MEEDDVKDHLEVNVDSLPNTTENIEDAQQHANCSPTFLWKCFQVAGMHTSKRPVASLNWLKVYWFPFLMHVALIVNMSVLVASIDTDNWNLKITLACASTNFLSVASWYCVNKNRFKLNTVINILSSVVNFDSGSGIVVMKFVLLVFLSIPNIYATIFVVYFRNSPDSSFWLYGSSVTAMDSFGTVLLFLNTNFYISLQVLFPGLCVCAYCFLCRSVYKWLKKSESGMKSTEENLSVKPLVTEYFKILAAAELLENSFSVPVFLIIFMHVLHMFSLLASLLTYKNYQFTVPIVCEAVVILLTSLCSMLAIVMCASLIPYQSNKLNKRWKRSAEEQVLEKGHVDMIVKLAAERETISMTACDIVVLQKKFLLSVFGALLTYGFLVIQINK